MSLGSESGVPAVMNVAPTGSGYNGNGGGWGGDWGAWIILFLIFGMFGWGGMGGFGGFGGGAGLQGALTRADLCSEFNFNGLENAVRGVQQGICDSAYALNNSINGLGVNVMQGFHGVDNAICNLGFTTQQGFNATQVAMMQGNNALQAQLAQCCCDNRVGQMQLANQMQADTCALTNTMNNNTRDTLANQDANARAILDALTAQRLEAKDERIAAQAAQIQALQLSASQAQQNAAIGAMISASEATILRRTGAECPTPAYVVQPPTPVNFPTNCCGTFNGWGNNGGCNGGCGC